LVCRLCTVPHCIEQLLLSCCCCCMHMRSCSCCLTQARPTPSS
jgi:hypothetical protein